MDYKNFAIIVAGGKGERMQSRTRKQYLTLGNIPILGHTVMKFDRCEDIHEIILVIPSKDIEYCQKYIVDPFQFSKTIHLTSGGQTRQDSVFNGLKFARTRSGYPEKTIVMIHDGVRPFVDDTIIKACIKNAVKHGACVPAVKITDTVKQADSDGCVEKTVKRDKLYGIQTPQGFKLNLILDAFDHAAKTDFAGTDDASLMEHSGHKVYIVKGSKRNIKITTPYDLVMGKYLLDSESGSK